VSAARAVVVAFADPFALLGSLELAAHVGERLRRRHVCLSTSTRNDP
jgi:hypothetical protein